ncbi:MAG: hypothetical protein JWR07_4078 [Nevskia sp.]|nr:hypothetical protein [Nevskia sp.]
MKVDHELISAALDSVLEQNKVTSFGAIPLKTLAEHWEAIRLRSTDLAAGIEALYGAGWIDLELRRDGLWVRRLDKGAGVHGAYEKLRTSLRGIVIGIALDRIHRRGGDGYCGMDRRRASRGSAAGPA